VPLGEQDPPLQAYTLRNGGQSPLSYSFDLSALEQLQQENYGHAVLTLADGEPSGDSRTSWPGSGCWVLGAGQLSNPHFGGQHLPSEVAALLCLSGRQSHCLTGTHAAAS
jgi:hypothetical protein